MKGKIFISYRRDDSQDATGRIYDVLETQFGRDSIFRDVDSVPYGEDYRRVVADALRQCATCLVVIGPSWTTVRDADGRRLQNPNDLVRIEVETAIELGVRVIPVLVTYARMPPSQELPGQVLPQLVFQNSLQVRPDKDFIRDAGRLVDALEEVVGRSVLAPKEVWAECRRCGLVSVRTSFQGFSYDRLVLDAEELLIVLNDGRSWIDSNREVLATRVRDRRKPLKCLLLHPKSEFLTTLVRKNGKKKETQIEEIMRSYRVLDELRAAGPPGLLDVRGHHLFNTHCLFLTEDQAVVMPYFYTESGALPMLTFDRRAEAPLYARYRSDALSLFDGAVTLSGDDFVG